MKALKKVTVVTSTENGHVVQDGHVLFENNDLYQVAVKDGFYRAAPSPSFGESALLTVGEKVDTIHDYSIYEGNLEDMVVYGTIKETEEVVELVATLNHVSVKESTLTDLEKVSLANPPKGKVDEVVDEVLEDNPDVDPSRVKAEIKQGISRAIDASENPYETTLMAAYRK